MYTTRRKRCILTIGQCQGFPCARGGPWGPVGIVGTRQFLPRYPRVYKQRQHTPVMGTIKTLFEPFHPIFYRWRFRAASANSAALDVK